MLGVAGGAVAGVAIAWAIGANASSTTPGGGQAAQPLAARQYATTGTGVPGPHGAPGYHIPATNGTVTAVGAHAVTIRTSSGTKTYAVTSTSDIDKNGEAQLSDLKAGDKVTFDTESVSGKTVIDHLHAGDEALDRPSFDHNGH